jgi:hypothetical protein
MTKLQQIRAKCVELLEQFPQQLRSGLYPSSAARSGWLSTIVAIDALGSIELRFETDGMVNDALEAIEASWPDELL